MHVTLVGGHPLPGETGRGGVERVVQVLRRKLARRLRVSLVVPNARQALRHNDGDGEIIYLKRPLLPGFLGYWSLSSKAVHREIERLAPDVVHVQDVAGVALLWPGGARWPTVFTPHGVLDVDLRHLAQRDMLRRLTAPVRASVVAAVERLSRVRYDDVIVINRYVLEAMPDLAGVRHHFVANPVDEVFLATPRAERLPGRSFRLLQVGVVSPLKNVMASIGIAHELIRRHLDIHLHVVGPVADAGYHRQCLAEVARLGIGQAVTFHGGVAPTEVAAWMDRADALLLPSRQEMAPMVVAEAHCRGLPVAVPRAFGLRWMVTEGLNGIFLDGPTPADDAERVAGFLHRAADREGIRREAVRQYESGSVIDRTIEIYREALGRQPGCQPDWASQASRG